nr:hypothetical protein [Pseudomonas sp. A46]
MDALIAFFKENSGWLFGGAGLFGTLIAVWKLFLSKPSIQQHQSVSNGNAVQAGRDVNIRKTERPE